MKLETPNISTILEIVTELQAGKIIILLDEEDRENEGDLVIAADFITPEAINFMVTNGRGLVCLTLTEERCSQIGLLPIASFNNKNTRYGTNFTQSIDAANGISTGVSAADRSHTIRTAVSSNTKPNDLIQPGHVFPVQALSGGVLIRAGHTEAGCDLTAIAGLNPAAVICEILKSDGTMARRSDLIKFSKYHKLKIGTISDLIQYRIEHESIINRMGQHSVQTVWGTFLVFAYQDIVTNSAHLALVHGNIDPIHETLVWIYEPSSLLDILDIKSNQQNNWSIHQALKTIISKPAGILILINCQLSANQLFKQFINRDIGLQYIPKGLNEPDNLRTSGIETQILRDLKVNKIRLLTHSRKILNIPELKHSYNKNL